MVSDKANVSHKYGICTALIPKKYSHLCLPTSPIIERKVVKKIVENENNENAVEGQAW